MSQASRLKASRLVGSGVWKPPGLGAVPLFSYSVVHVYPHDPEAWTQGIQYADGMLYEGTGLNGRSSIRKVARETGRVLEQRHLAREHFGEGITVFKDEIVQVTLKTGVAFVYDRDSLEPKRTFTFAGQGWGLTNDGAHLLMSDGTDEIRVIDPHSFLERSRIRVTAAGTAVRRLNELEYACGEIMANVFPTDYIARIAPDTGEVTGYIDLSGLLSPIERARADVLNGTAHDNHRINRLHVTGKLWPKLFEVDIVPSGRRHRTSVSLGGIRR